jgi:hypothetical protein
MVNAFQQEGVDVKGQGVLEAELEKLNLERHAVCPNWNYPIRLVGGCHLALSQCRVEAGEGGNFGIALYDCVQGRGADVDHPAAECRDSNR